LSAAAISILLAAPEDTNLLIDKNLHSFQNNFSVFWKKKNWNEFVTKTI
jgi:hypothetical protein